MNTSFKLMFQFYIVEQQKKILLSYLDYIPTLAFETSNAKAACLLFGVVDLCFLLDLGH